MKLGFVFLLVIWILVLVADFELGKAVGRNIEATRQLVEVCYEVYEETGEIEGVCIEQILKERP